MKQIYKYKHVAVAINITLNIPEDAKFLSLQMQNSFLCFWFLVNPENHKKRRYFRIFGTGWDFDDSHLEYIGTVQDGSFVWHVFEERNKYERKV